MDIVFLDFSKTFNRQHCRVFNGYINIDISSFIKLYLHLERYLLRGEEEIKLKKNYRYARTDVFRV